MRERGLLEETIVLLPTPQSVIAEGIASIAPAVLLDRAPEVFARVAEAAGIDIDFPRAVAVESALEPCRWAEVNAALMLYEDGAGEDEVRAYLEHWGVLDAELSAHAMRFLRGREVARLRHQLPGRPRAVRGLRRRRPGPLPPPALGAGAGRRAAGRGGLGAAQTVWIRRTTSSSRRSSVATSIHSASVWSSPPTGPRPSSVGMPHAPVQQPSETPPESSRADVEAEVAGVAERGREQVGGDAASAARCRGRRARARRRRRGSAARARPRASSRSAATLERMSSVARAVPGHACWPSRRRRRS